jgi:predicted nicotinamide N-methyase
MEPKLEEQDFQYYPTFVKKEEIEDDDSSVDSTDSLHEFIQFKSHVNADGLEESISFSYPGTHRTLTLSTKLLEEDLAPIFDGSSWAGTRVWSASIFGIKYLLETYPGNVSGKTLCELGAGLGVPGMVWHMMGGSTVLTEHERIMSQLNVNTATNFPQTYGTTITTHPLSWSRTAFQQLLQTQRLEHGFDVLLNCDCIFEPLYGRSWMNLAEVIDENLKSNPKSLVISCVERRAQDGINEFVKYLETMEHVLNVQLVALDVQAHRRLEIYLTQGRCD